MTWVRRQDQNRRRRGVATLRGFCPANGTHIICSQPQQGPFSDSFPGDCPDDRCFGSGDGGTPEHRQHEMVRCTPSCVCSLCLCCGDREKKLECSFSRPVFLGSRTYMGDVQRVDPSLHRIRAHVGHAGRRLSMGDICRRRPGGCTLSGYFARNETILAFTTSGYSTCGAWPAFFTGKKSLVTNRFLTLVLSV